MPQEQLKKMKEGFWWGFVAVGIINKIKLYEIDHIMNKNNFELVDIQGHSYSKKNQINWFDMLYINKKFSQKRN